jgi:hypothetical protein
MRSERDFYNYSIYNTLSSSSLEREFEQENEVGRRRRGWQFLPVLHIILRILSLGSGVKTDYRDSGLAVYAWMLTQVLTLIRTKQRDMNPYPVFVLLPSFTTNILAKFVVNFVPNEGRRTKTGYSFMSGCFFFWVRTRIRVSIINSDTWEDTLSNHQWRPTPYAQDNVQTAKLSSSKTTKYEDEDVKLSKKSRCDSEIWLPLINWIGILKGWLWLVTCNSIDRVLHSFTYNLGMKNKD